MSFPRSVCVFCGSSDRGPRRHRAAAARLGALAAGGRVVGVIPEHLMRREVGHLQTTELIVTATMHERKATMFARADAFVVLPGGPGTLDETFEILTWRQLGLHDKPVVVCDSDGYWRPLTALVEHMIRSRYVKAAFRDFFSVAPDPEAVIDRLRHAPPRRRPTRADRI